MKMIFSHRKSYKFYNFCDTISNRINEHKITDKTVNRLTYRFVTGKDAFVKYQRSDLETAPRCLLSTIARNKLELIEKNSELQLTLKNNNTNHLRMSFLALASFFRSRISDGPGSASSFWSVLIVGTFLW
jgi:hypothetical protein